MWLELSLLAIFLFVLFVLIYLKLKYVYVSKNFENPLAFRIQAFIFILTSAIARFANFFKISNEVTVFKAILSRLVKCFPSSISQNSIQISDKVINGTTIRIYTPISSINTTLPCVIYFHGGGFIFPKIKPYEYYLTKLATELNFLVISVHYCQAPELPYPLAVNDCFKITEHLFENSHQYNIDPSRVVLAGDSAGGNIVAVITQKLALKNKHFPKLQILVYPWLQVYNARLPSLIEYGEKNFCQSLIFSKFALWYLGRSSITNEMINTIQFNYHRLLIDDEQLRNKYDSYLNVDLIPSNYKIGKSYYEKYETLKANIYPTKLDKNHILNRDIQFKIDLKNLFNKNFSPLLADDEILRKLPPAYFILLEWDMLKDEGLIYSERLRLNDVFVHVAFYEDAFHGIGTFISQFNGYHIARKMFYDMTNFIKSFV